MSLKKAFLRVFVVMQETAVAEKRVQTMPGLKQRSFAYFVGYLTRAVLTHAFIALGVYFFGHLIHFVYCDDRRLGRSRRPGASIGQEKPVQERLRLN